MARGNGAAMKHGMGRAAARVRHSAKGKQTGFTLIEIIIAFAVLALALTLLLGTLSGSARQVRDSADAGRAALHAQSLLAQTGVGEVLQPGARDGEFDDGKYRWTMQISDYTDPLRPRQDALQNPGAPHLLRLALTVQWGDGGPGRQLSLETLRLATPDMTQSVTP